MKTVNPQETTHTIQATLADIARELSRISAALAARVGDDSPEAETLKASQNVLANLAHQLEEGTLGQETPQPEKQETARLRKAVLENLYRRGPALFPELAAATLSLPDEIRPVLQAMEQEGLVEIQALRGWETVSLTAQGRAALRNAQGGTALR